MAAGSGPMASDDQRIDKWLWCARFFKSRSQATDAVAGGRAHLNGERVNPARAVTPGEEHPLEDFVGREPEDDLPVTLAGDVGEAVVGRGARGHPSGDDDADEGRETWRELVLVARRDRRPGACRHVTEAASSLGVTVRAAQVDHHGDRRPDLQPRRDTERGVGGELKADVDIVDGGGEILAVLVEAPDAPAPGQRGRDRGHLRGR